MERTSYLLGSVQRCLFPYLREEVGELTEKERRFVLVLEVVEVEKHVRNYHWRGRKPKDRKPLARSFVAKAFYNIPSHRGIVGAFETGQAFPAIMRLGVLVSGSKRIDSSSNVR